MEGYAAGSGDLYEALEAAGRVDEAVLHIYMDSAIEAADGSLIVDAAVTEEGDSPPSLGLQADRISPQDQIF